MKKPKVTKLKSISISGSLYTRLRAYAAEQGWSISTIVEQTIAADLGQDPPAARPARRYRGPRG